MNNQSISPVENNLIVSFAPYAVWSPHFETELEIIQNHLDRGGKALILSCNGNLRICEPNPTHDLLFCAMCKGRFRSGMKWLNNSNAVYNNFENVTKMQAKIISEIEDKKWINFEEVRQFKIDGADIGMSAASSVISLLRETNPDINIYEDIIRRHIVTAAIVYFSLYNNLLKFKPLKLILFNGRFSSLRPAMRAAQLLSIPCEVHERAGGLEKYNIFKNTYPHNLQSCKDKLEEYYITCKINQDDAWQITTEWFEQRRNGIDQIWPSQIKYQHKGLLPQGFSHEKINIVIFNSSDDEYAACSEWNMPFHGDQNASIDRLMKEIGNNQKFNFFLRVHPNLKNIKNTQTKNIQILSKKYKNLYIIPPESRVHSYSLIDASDVVITYGSTVGIEAAFAGKISILMGRALYEDLNIVLKPNSENELAGLLLKISKGDVITRSEDMKIGFIKYVLYTLYHGQKFNHVIPTGLFSAKMLKNGRITKIKANQIVWLLSKLKTKITSFFRILRNS